MLSLKSKPSVQKNLFSRGFTLIELMVTVGIFVFMTALLLAKYNSFYSGTIFNNLAYDIALTIRQAQTYGISVRVANPSIPGNFRVAYGVHFATATNDQFVLFADTAADKLYDPAGDLDEKKYYIKQGAKIDSICAGTSSSDCQSVEALDISFLRPDPSARFLYSRSGVRYRNPTDSYVEITLQSGDGTATKKVVVTKVGQISVTN